MREALMRLTALAALAAAGDLLAPEGGMRQGVRLVGGLLTALALLDLAGRAAGALGFA